MIGPFIVTLAGFVLPVNDPVPVPVQPLNAKPLLGVAVICTVCPLLKNDPLAGCTLPPVPAFIVSWYCVVKFAVYVVALFGAVMPCDIVPASVHELQT
jgi:hypothetical protein